MKTLRFVATALSSTFALLFASASFGQGSLTPPAGPPAPTMKTLDQVEARTIVNAKNTPGDATNTYIISAPGSYYLAGNINGASGKHGISVLANNVTLDLNGFALISGGGGATRGVNTSTPIVNFSIRNGNVRGWTDGGVRAESAVTLAEKLLLADNVGGIGLAVGNGSLVKDCVASGNETGFYSGDRAQLTNCIATVNKGNGFDCASYVNLIDCTSSRNGGDGIVTQGGCSIVRCSVTRNLPSGSGLLAGPGCTIVDCTASNNGFIGIHTKPGSTVQGCTVQGNDIYGISVSDNCRIIGNTCDDNNVSGLGGGGIRIFGNGNRIEGNSCTSTKNAGFGIQISSGANNLVIRNSVHGHGVGSSFSLAAGNRHGAIVDLRANNPDTVSDAATSTLRTSDPWANFIH